PRPPTVLPGSTGSYEEASAPLQEALCPTHPPEAARARRGLLQLKKGDVPAAVQDLQCLAEADAQDLRFLLQLLEASERHSVAQAAAQEASTLLDTGHPRRALGYCSLAVLAGGGSTRHLRLRAACLAELREVDRALQDLDHVIQEGAGDGDLARQAEDFSSRGRLLLSLGDEEGATGAFAQALELSPALAQSRLWAQPGQAPTASMFLRLGQCCLEEKRYGEALTVAQSGLLVNPHHGGLRRLKARTQRETASGCRLL
uniref:tetratricopeptide repeat protein 34 n=1 Tax=Urocitellus parryii TaxID=9999 RepID=UPI000E558964